MIIKIIFIIIIIIIIIISIKLSEVDRKTRTEFPRILLLGVNFEIKIFKI